MIYEWVTNLLPCSLSNQRRLCSPFFAFFIIVAMSLRLCVRVCVWSVCNCKCAHAGNCHMYSTMGTFSLGSIKCNYRHIASGCRQRDGEGTGRNGERGKTEGRRQGLASPGAALVQLMVKGRTSSNCTKSRQRCRLVAMKAAPFPDPSPSPSISLYLSFSLFLSHSCLPLPPSPWLSPTATTNTFWLTTHIFYWLEEAAPHGPSREFIRSVGGGEDRSVGRSTGRAGVLPEKLGSCCCCCQAEAAN